MNASVVEIAFLSLASVMTLLVAVAIYYAVLLLVSFVEDAVDEASTFLNDIVPRITAVESSMDQAFRQARTSISEKSAALKKDVNTMIKDWESDITTFAVNVQNTWEHAPKYFLSQLDQAVESVVTVMQMDAASIRDTLEDPRLYENIVVATFHAIDDLLGC
jgi:predicted PurR-regulated permease PerM